MDWGPKPWDRISSGSPTTWPSSGSPVIAALLDWDKARLQHSIFAAEGNQSCREIECPYCGTPYRDWISKCTQCGGPVGYGKNHTEQIPAFYMGRPIEI